MLKTCFLVRRCVAWVGSTPNVLSFTWSVSHVAPCQSGEDTGGAGPEEEGKDSGSGSRGGQGAWSFQQQDSRPGPGEPQGPGSASHSLTLLGGIFLTTSC